MGQRASRKAKIPRHGTQLHPRPAAAVGERNLRATQSGGSSHRNGMSSPNADHTRQAHLPPRAYSVQLCADLLLHLGRFRTQQQIRLSNRPAGGPPRKTRVLRRDARCWLWASGGATAKPIRKAGVQGFSTATTITIQLGARRAVAWMRAHLRHVAIVLKMCSPSCAGNLSNLHAPRDSGVNNAGRVV